MKEYVLLAFVALLSGRTKGEKCVCTSYWECITTGGSPIAYCGQETNEVCCVHGELAQDNTLNGEGIGSVSQPEQRKTFNDTLPGEPPPPVRLFGDRKVKPIINTAFQNAIPVRQIKTSSDNVGKFSQNRELLDAFPPNLVSPPDIIDPLKRNRQRGNTRTTLLSNLRPTPTSGRSLSFTARGPPQFPRVPVAFAPLTNSASLTVEDETFNPEQSQPGRLLPPLAVPVGQVDSTQRTFSFVDSASPNRRPPESQSNVSRKPKFSFRDTRP